MLFSIHYLMTGSILLPEDWRRSLGTIDAKAVGCVISHTGK